MNQTAKFWDKIAERYAKQPIADEAAYQKKLQVTREYLQPNMNVLEFGCGTGSTAILHAPYVQHIHAKELEDSLTDAGFGLDYQWQPSKGKAVFMVAQKANGSD